MDKITGYLQENILGILCFNDANCKLVRDVVEPELFDSKIYRDIAEVAGCYIDDFGKAPKEHIADLFERQLNEGSPEAELLRGTLSNLHGLRESLNPDYVLRELEKFVRQQHLKDGITKAVEELQAGNLDEAESSILSSLERRLKVFNPGIFVDRPEDCLGFFQEDADCFPTGIPQLDNVGMGPARKELLVFLAPPSRGKTWWLVNLGKHCMMRRLKVCHVTLEMSEQKMMRRYVQALFSVSRKSGSFSIPTFEKDDIGRLVSLDVERIEDRSSLQDLGIKSILKRRLEGMKGRLNLVVKQFPTAMLTIRELRAYLDLLERAYRFVPDLLVVDYADLMSIDVKNVRLDTSRVYKELRGLAVERNIAVATASQTNRTGAAAKLVTDIHMAEDYSKVGTADGIISYNQTLQEKAIGLARLFVVKNRNEKDAFTTLISQCYDLGQFCLDSTLMVSRYWDELRNAFGSDDAEEGDREE